MPPSARHVLVRIARTTVSLLAFGAAWFAAVVAFDIPDFLLPSPLAIIPKLAFLATNANLWVHTATTLIEIAEGFAIGTVIGVAAGAVFARSPRSERLAAPLVMIVQTAPKIAIAPLLLLWLGIGAAPKIVLVAAVVFFPVLAASVSGFRYVDAAYRDLARILRLTRWQVFRRIEIPFALPPILAGLRIASTQAVTAAVIGELMGANRGLGYLLAMGQENSDAGIVIAVVLMLCVVGWLFHEGVALIEHWALGWHGSQGMQAQA